MVVGGVAMYIILVYDIKTDTKGKKILPKVHKICKKYLVHIQNSVFEGEITDANLLMLEKEVSSIIREDEDSVIVFKSRNSKWLDKSFWGNTEDATSRFI